MLLSTTSSRGKRGTSWDRHLPGGLADCLPSARRRSNRINVTDVRRSASHSSRRKRGSQQTDWRARGPSATHSATQAPTNIATGSSTFHVKCTHSRKRAHARTHTRRLTRFCVCVCFFCVTQFLQFFKQLSSSLFSLFRAKATVSTTGLLALGQEWEKITFWSVLNHRRRRRGIPIFQGECSVLI